MPAISRDTAALEAKLSSAALELRQVLASVDTGVQKRDEHLQGGDFFDAGKFPEIRFEGVKAEKGENGWLLIGKFTIHGTTRALKLPVTVSGPVTDPWGNQRIGMQAKTTINRHDYGVGSDKAVDKMVGDEVTLDIALEAVAKKK